MSCSPNFSNLFPTYAISSTHLMTLHNTSWIVFFFTFTQHMWAIYTHRDFVCCRELYHLKFSFHYCTWSLQDGDFKVYACSRYTLRHKIVGTCYTLVIHIYFLDLNFLFIHFEEILDFWTRKTWNDKNSWFNIIM